MFGGGAGHIADMIARLKTNNALLRKKSYFHTMMNYPYSKKKRKIIFPVKTSKSRLEQESEITEFINEDRRNLVTGIFVAIAIFFIMILIVNLLWEFGLREYLYKAFGEKTEY